MSDAATTEYVDYPVMMVHPHFTASKTTGVPGSEIRDGNGNVIGYRDYRGTPQRFPPVTVNNEDQEEYHKSQGYVRHGKGDPAAYVKAHSDDISPETYKPQKYPMWKNGVLIMTAQEDPDASDEDLAPPKAEEPVQTAPQAAVDAAAQNALRAAEELTLAQRETISAKDAELAEMRAEIERLNALKDKRTAPKKQTEAA